MALQSAMAFNCHWSHHTS